MPSNIPSVYEQARFLLGNICTSWAYSLEPHLANALSRNAPNLSRFFLSIVEREAGKDKSHSFVAANASKCALRLLLGSSVSSFKKSLK
jgi:hypothetical protein